jgi:four helix bundle protein
MNEIDLKLRTKKFALEVIKVVGSLPYNMVNRNLGDQLLRSATSVSANYRAACRGRSKAEFIAKLGICEEEADEASHWLELFMESEIANNDIMLTLRKEAHELTAIFAASIKTSRHNISADSKIPNPKSKIAQP